MRACCIIVASVTVLGLTIACLAALRLADPASGFAKRQDFGAPVMFTPCDGARARSETHSFILVSPLSAFFLGSPTALRDRIGLLRHRRITFMTTLGRAICAFEGVLPLKKPNLKYNRLSQQGRWALRTSALDVRKGVGPIKIDRVPCPRCGGKLEFKDTVESPATGSLVHFFRCEACGHVRSDVRRSA